MFLLQLLWPTSHDRHDEAEAVRVREDLGRRGRLVSWRRRRDGRWLARVSDPEFPGTIERSGRTRCEAIRLAASYLAGLLDDDV